MKFNTVISTGLKLFFSAVTTVNRALEKTQINISKYTRKKQDVNLLTRVVIYCI